MCLKNPAEPNLLLVVQQQTKEHGSRNVDLSVDDLAELGPSIAGSSQNPQDLGSLILIEILGAKPNWNPVEVESGFIT